MVKKKYCGFTLAEVFITLAIIGVVAALTIPTVVKNYQKTQTVVKLKKVYNTLNQMTSQATADYGASSGWEYKHFKSNTQEACNIWLTPILSHI